MKEIKYIDFTLREKEYYIIRIIDHPYYNLKADRVVYGVAQLTRIDVGGENSDREYYVLHLKHNKKEYLQFLWGYDSQSHYRGNCTIIRPHTAEFGLAYRNSRILVTADNLYYFPKGYNPGGHDKKG